MIETMMVSLFFYGLVAVVTANIIDADTHVGGKEALSIGTWWPIYLIKFLLKSFWKAISTW